VGYGMASIPDIIVTSADSPSVLIAVAALLHNNSIESAAHRLRHYMAKMSCPVGLLVLPEELYIYRNRYTGADERSIDEIGHYQLGNVFQMFAHISAGKNPETKEDLFESYVQDWLEHLPNSSEIERLPAKLKDALETHVIPVLENGIVRAAGPREIRSAF
jgi:hypothetical protein